MNWPVSHTHDEQTLTTNPIAQSFSTHLGSDDDERRVRHVMPDLGNPSVRHALGRAGIVERRADDEDICLRVREWSEAVVVFLSSRVPDDGPQTTAPQAAGSHTTQSIRC